MDRLEARHRACGERGGETLLLGRHGAGEARDAVPHLDVDARVAQLRAAFERLSHRALDALVVRLHGLLLRRRNHLEPVHDALHAARPPRVLLGRRPGLRRRHHAEERHRSAVGIDTDIDGRPPTFTERTKVRLPLSVSSALSASSTCALIRESDCRTTSRARAGARTARTAASTAPVSHDAARMLVPITGRARRPRSPRALARRAGHPPSAVSPISYRSTFRATAKIGRRASGATKLPVKSGQRWPVPVTRPVYGLHGTAWRRVRRGLATRRPALERGDRLVPVQLVVERLQADAERLGRLLLVPAVLVQGGENEAALGFGERATDLELDHPARRRSPCFRPVLGVRAQQWNVRGLDLLVGEDEGAMHGILELAHVARPLVPPQEIQRGAADFLLLLLGGGTSGRAHV